MTSISNQTWKIDINSFQISIYMKYIIYLILMQEQAKLVVAEQLDKQKLQFIVFTKQIVGEGGFGVVKKAIRNDRPQQQLVVKIIPFDDQKKRQKIQKEINIIRKLPLHPNLVRVQPIKCFSTNNYYIFMEYCPDGTLDDLRKKKKGAFTQAEIFNIFYQLMNGYKVLWQAKILHQDLKLENVLIKDDIYKLTDFGFSIFYQGVKHGNIREGTLPYMPIQKLTQKQYYATTKSDVYSMGIILFKLITGHHPYVQIQTKEYRTYLKQLKVNPLYLRPNFSSKFSIKFQHFFDLVLKMVAKTQSARIDFDTVYEYIQNEEMFEEMHRKVHEKDKLYEKADYQKFVITGQSEAIAINFNIPEQEQGKYKQELQNKANSQQKQEQQRIIKELENYIVSHRIIVYFFDRLTRRIYIEKLKKTSNLNPKQYATMEQIIFGLLLFCKKIIQNLLKQCKSGVKYPLNNWKNFWKTGSNLLKMIERDQNYLQDLIIDCLSQSSQTKIKQKKQLLDKSKQDIAEFKKFIKQSLENLEKIKTSVINPDNRQNLITICYIRNGIEMLENFEKWEKDAIDLEKYFRQIETEDAEVLFTKVTSNLLNKELDFTIDLGTEE